MMRSPKIGQLAALLLVAAPLPLLAQPAAPMGQAASPPLPPAAASQPFAPAPGQPAAPAQATAPVQTAAPPQAAGSQAQAQVQAATEQRITGLQTQLSITPAQAPQWNAFAQVMRENAQATDALFRQRAAAAQTMNAVANMQSYAQISRAYADGTDKLTTAFQALYATLSDQQKQAADTLFRQQAAQSVAAAGSKPK